uniref:Uncharacterized protein n=1 Tax=Caenorhabditis japonica TaxID=281687 RepID=A0A8R1EC67_CAEJA
MFVYEPEERTFKSWYSRYKDTITENGSLFQGAVRTRWQHFLLQDVRVHVALHGSGDSDERAYAICVNATPHHEVATTVLNGWNLVLWIVPFVNWASYKSDYFRTNHQIL